MRKKSTFGMAFIALLYVFVGIMCIPANAQWTMNGTDIYFNNGNVGIGTASPEGMLHVTGTSRFDSNIYIGNSWIFLGAGLGFRDNGINAVGFYNSAGNVVRHSLDLTTGNSYLARGGGNVGIGTTNPEEKLDVSGNIMMHSGNFMWTDGGQYSRIWSPGQAIGSAAYHGQYGIDMTYLANYSGGWKCTAGGTASALGTAEGRLTFSNGACAGAGAVLTWTDRFHIDPAGNVGIGITNPATRLEVSGSLDASIMQALSSTHTAGLGIDSIGTYWGASIFQDGTKRFTVEANNGILVGDSTYQAVNAPANGAIIQGNVGIGTTNPQAKLQVDGNVIINGNLAAKYQDIAEWVPAKKMIPAASVVILAPGELNAVIESSKEYDTRVAGVVSSNPGIVLGEGGNDKVKIATTGRVKVRVDATGAPIEVGDLLVSSSKPGMAMRSDPIDVGGIAIHRPGTLIGKALEPLEGGEGEILVLLSLQ